MNPRRIIIIGTMALAITIGGAVCGDEANADEHTRTKGGHIPTQNVSTPVKEDLTKMLRVASDEDIYNALYNGKSLADIAEANQVDVEDIIELQVAELTEQLNARLHNGSLTPCEYQSHLSELRDIITKSTYGIMYKHKDHPEADE